MGTRSLTIVRSGLKNDSPRIVTIYRQMDGYPSGMGKDLADFLSKIKMTNGISGDSTNTANGVGCLAAQLVAHLKDGAGSIYLEAGSDNDKPGDYSEEWVYEISADTMNPKEGIRMTCKDVYENKIIFDGKPELFEKVAAENE